MAEKEEEGYLFIYVFLLRVLDSVVLVFLYACFLLARLGQGEKRTSISQEVFIRRLV